MLNTPPRSLSLSTTTAGINYCGQQKGQTASLWSVGSQTAGSHSPQDYRMTCRADTRRVLKDKFLILLATAEITEGGDKNKTTE